MSDLKLTEGHVYKVGDRPITGVTSSISTNFGKRDHWNEWHRDRGNAVHLAIHYLVNNRLDWDTVDERIKPRIEAFQKFLGQTGFEVVESELQMFSKKYQFAGTCDLVLTDGKDLILADIKGTIEPVAELQLAAYSLLYEENFKKKIKKACAIELCDTGYYKLKWVENLKRSQRIFLANLTIANWKNQNYNHKESYHG